MRRSSGRWLGPAVVRSGERRVVPGSASMTARLVWSTRLPGASPVEMESLVSQCFAGPDLCVVVEVGRGTPRALRGRLVATALGPRSSEMVLRLETAGAAGHGAAGRRPGCAEVARVELRLDDAGRFELPGLPRGPMRVLVTHPGRPVIATSWVLVD